MKTVSRMLMVIVIAMVLVTPLSGVAQKTQQAEKTLIGYVSDNHLWLETHGRYG